MAGSQMRFGRTSPALPIGSGVKRMERARSVVVRLPVALVLSAVAEAEPAFPHLGLDALICEPLAQRVEAPPVRGLSFAVRLQDLLEAVHATREVRDRFQAESGLAGLGLLEAR